MLNRIFDFDSPLVHFVFRLADLVILNLMTIFCMLPVFTIGPALKALAFTSLKMVREEDGNVIKTYWLNFKMNFRQTVGFGLICLVALLIILGDVYTLIYLNQMFPLPAILAATFVIILVVFTLLYAIPMQGRFTNKVKDTFKNAFWASLIKFPKSFIMLCCWIVLPSFYLFVSQNFLPVILFLGLSLPAYLNALIYDPFFREMEERITKRNQSEEEIE